MTRPLLHVGSFSSIRRVHTHTTHYLIENPALSDGIDRCLWAWRSLLYLAPAMVYAPSARYLAPASFAGIEAGDSYWLADMGFYRQAVAALRTALELAVNAVHFTRDEEPGESFVKWFVGEYHYKAFKRDILTPMFRSPRFVCFGLADALRSDIEKCYDALCSYSHSRGFCHSAAGMLTDRELPPLQQTHKLVPQSVEQYSAFLRDVTRCSVTLGLLRYPVAMQALPLFKGPRDEHFPPLGFFTPEDRQDAINVLGNETATALQTMSDNNPGVQFVVEKVNSLPDDNTLEGKADWDLERHNDRLAEWFSECESRSQAWFAERERRERG